MAADGDGGRQFDRRAFFLGAVQAGAGIALIGRMAQLSIAEADKYKVAAEDNRVALHLIPPRRGWIVDATGAALATNRPAYAVELVPSLAGDFEAALARIAAIVPLAPADLARIRDDAKDLPPSAALIIANDIGWDAFAALNLELADMPGLQPLRTYVRHYPDGEAFAHVTGYVGRPTAEQYRETKDPLYMLPGFRIGKDGVERSKDAQLRGKPGARRVEVNARGRIIAEGSPLELKQQAGRASLVVTVADAADLESARALLARTGADVFVDVGARRLTASADGLDDMIQVAGWLRDAGITVDDIGLSRPSLDDVFLTLTGHRTEDNEELSA